MANIGNLHANLTTSSASFQKDMGKAANSVRSSSAKMNRSLARLQRSFGNVQRSVKRTVKGMFSLRSMIATVAGGAGIGLAIKSSLDFADAIGKTADRIGLTTAALQQYRHAAKLSGVAQSTLDKGFEAFAKRLGEARAGTGAMVTYLRKYNKETLNTVLNAKSTEDALKIIFRTMDNMTEASDRAALSAAAFSRTAGVQMANLVREGASGLNDMLREARELGLVIDESLIREAEEANDSVTRLSSVLKIQMVATLLELGPTITEVTDNMVKWVKQNKLFIKQKIGSILTGLGSAFIGFSDSVDMATKAYSRFLDIFYGPVTGDPKKFAKKGLEKELELANRSYQLMVQQGNIDQEVLRSAEQRIFTLKQRIAIKADEIRMGRSQKASISAVERFAPGFVSDIRSAKNVTASDVDLDYSTWVKDYIASLTDMVDQSSDSWLMIERVSKKSIGKIEKEVDTWTKNYIGSLSDMVDYSSDSWMEIAKIAKEQNKKTVDIYEETYKNMLTNIQGAFADTFYDMFTGQLDSFDDFADSMKNIFFRTLSEMAAKAAMTKLSPLLGGTGGQAGGGLLAGTGLGAAIPYVGAAMMGYSVGQMIGGWLKGNPRHARYKFDSGWQATAGLDSYGEYNAISNITHHGKGKNITDTIRDMYEGYVDQANMLANIVGTQGAIAFTPHKRKFKMENAEEELAKLAKRWAETLWNAFDNAFERMGFSSMEAVIKGINREQNALGNAFQASLTSGSWIDFKQSIADQIYNTITQDLTQQLIQSQAIQGVLMPIYGQIAKGMTAATAGGGFDMGIFGQYATSAVSQLGGALTPIKPAFDAMADLSQRLKDILIGSFQHGGIVPETGLAMVHKGEHISPNGGGGAVIINADVITTNDVDTWLAERIQRIDTLRVGKKISKVEMTTAGLDI